MKLTFKAKRNIGLIVLTVAVVAVIILVMVLVQKYGNDEKTKKGAVGQEISTERLNLQVVDLDNSLKEFADKKAGEGKCFMLAKVSVKAKTNFTLSPKKFSLSDGKKVNVQADGYDFLTKKVKLKEGEEKTFYLLFEVEANRVESFYLSGYSCRVDMGGSLANAFS